MSGRPRRALLVLAVLAIVLGAVALVKARDVPFTAANPAAVDPGAVLFGTSDDLPWGKLLQFSPLGALVTLGLGGAALLGAWLRVRALVIVAAVGFAACAVQVLVQFGHEPNVLGGRGGNLALFLALAVGLATLVLNPADEIGIAGDHPT